MYWIKTNDNVMTTLYLVRHGQTVDNVNMIMQGQTHGRLTPEGCRQARLLAVEMAGWQVDAFVASDLRRAVDTAAILAGPHGLEVRQTPLLRERDWGGFTGRYIPDLKNAEWPDDIETLGEMQARAAEFIRFVRSEYGGKSVVAVGHGIINKAVQAVYYGKRMNEIKPMENMEVRVLDLE